MRTWFGIGMGCLVWLVGVAGVASAQSQEGTEPEDKAAAFYRQGVALEDAGKTDQAAEAYKKAIAIGTSDIKPFLNLALIYKGAGKFSESEKVLTNAIADAEKRQAPAKDMAVLLNNLGNVHRAAGEYMKAIEVLTKALSLEPQLIGPNLNIGLCYDVGLRQSAKAVPYYLAEAKIAPDAKSTYEAYLNLGIHYQEVEKQIDKSITYLEKAIAVNPDGFDRYKAYNSLANSLYLKNDVKGAIKNWRIVVKIAPNTESGRNAQHNLRQLE
jgi:tetratricopeptide (TPR) repeat protein